MCVEELIPINRDAGVLRIGFAISILVSSLTACKSGSAPESAPMKDPRSSAAAPLPTDAEITSLVERQLAADEHTNRAYITVQTERGIVTLSGIANTEDTKQSAEAIAGATYGVKEFHNDIQVRAAPPALAIPAERPPINANKTGGPRTRRR